MIELSDDDLLPRMSMLLSPKSAEYDESPAVMKKPVSDVLKTGVEWNCVSNGLKSKFTWAIVVT